MTLKKNPFYTVFKRDSSYRAFFVAVIAMGLGYGLYKGILDNYLAEIVQMNQVDRGFTEFFREMTGLLLIFVLALLYTFSAEKLYKIGAAIMVIGMTLQAIIPPYKVLMIACITLFAMGDHIQLGMKSTMTLNFAQEGHGGRALGLLSSVDQIGTLIGYLVVILAFWLIPGDAPYKMFFYIAAILMAVSMIFALRIKGNSKTDESRRRLYFNKKFTKYYMLEVFYGARKQVFFTFGPYVLILFYGANTVTISLLFAISAIACFFLAPLVGKIIDHFGYKVVMVSDTLILVIVCFFYGFAHHIFPKEVAFVVCCANYVFDAIISMASMASNVYVQDIAEDQDEVRATISTGISVNHLITIFIALCGGWIWRSLGIEILFILSAVLGLCNSAYAATIKTKKQIKQIR